MKTPNPLIDVQRITHLPIDMIQQFDALRDPGTEWDEIEGKKFVSDSNNGLFLAFVDNKVVGFLTAHRLQRLDKRQAEVLLYEIGVDEHYRQQGVGTTLIQAVKEWAKEVAADEVWVLTNKSNIPAMALYTSMGGEAENADEQMFTFKI